MEKRFICFEFLETLHEFIICVNIVLCNFIWLKWKHLVQITFKKWALGSSKLRVIFIACQVQLKFLFFCYRLCFKKQTHLGKVLIILDAIFFEKNSFNIEQKRNKLYDWIFSKRSISVREQQIDQFIDDIEE